MLPLFSRLLARTIMKDNGSFTEAAEREAAGPYDGYDYTRAHGIFNGNILERASSTCHISLVNYLTSITGSQLK